MVILKDAIVPSASLPDNTGITVGPALNGTKVLMLVAVGGVLAMGKLYVAMLLTEPVLSVAV